MSSVTLISQRLGHGTYFSSPSPLPFSPFLSFPLSYLQSDHTEGKPTAQGYIKYINALWLTSCFTLLFNISVSSLLCFQITFLSICFLTWLSITTSAVTCLSPHFFVCHTESTGNAVFLLSQNSLNKCLAKST